MPNASSLAGTNRVARELEPLLPDTASVRLVTDVQSYPIFLTAGTTFAAFFCPASVRRAVTVKPYTSSYCLPKLLSTLLLSVSAQTTNEVHPATPTTVPTTRRLSFTQLLTTIWYSNGSRFQIPQDS